MNLIIDVGNTFIKLAVFKENTLVYKKKTTKKNFFDAFKGIAESFKGITDVIISSVGSFTKEEISLIKAKFKTHILDYKTSVPFINKYKTPRTLGVDRIALISAAAVQYPNQNVLVVDVGSCITLDFINTENEYLGGAISPGINLRYQSLHNYTDKLPLLKVKIPKKSIGNSTNTSIHIGVVQGVINEIDGFISAYKEKYKELTIILTGGGAQYLVDSLKNDIFAHANFLLEGLNYILQNNKDTC